MDFRQLEAFVYVVQDRSFSAAAKKLFLTQPTISSHIRALEEELDTQLIQRTPKAAIPTEVGQILYQHAQKMLKLRNQAIEECYACNKIIDGSISIAASSVPYLHILPKIMTSFHAKYPEVTFHLQNKNSKEAIDLIDSEKAEIGIVGTAINSPKFTFQKLIKDTFVVATPNTPDFQNLDHSIFPLSKIDKFPYIAREAGSGTQIETELYLYNHNIDPHKLQIVARMDSSNAILHSISQGMGISILSQLAALDYQESGKILTFHLANPAAERHIYITYLKDKQLSKAAQAFVKFAIMQTST